MIVQEKAPRCSERNRGNGLETMVNWPGSETMETNRAVVLLCCVLSGLVVWGCNDRESPEDGGQRRFTTIDKKEIEAYAERLRRATTVDEQCDAIVELRNWTLGLDEESFAQRVGPRGMLEFWITDSEKGEVIAYRFEARFKRQPKFPARARMRYSWIETPRGHGDESDDEYSFTFDVLGIEVLRAYDDRDIPPGIMF